jgi:hypothetical protein
METNSSDFKFNITNIKEDNVKIINNAWNRFKKLYPTEFKNPEK